MFGRIVKTLSVLAITSTVAVHSSPVEIPRPQDPIAPGFAEELSAQRALGTLERETGASWRLHAANGATGTIHLAYGSGVDLGVGRIESADAALSAARGFVAAHPLVFGIDTEDLEVWDVAWAPGKWGVNFRQLHEGLRVLGGRVDVTLTDGGRVFVIGADVYGEIEVATTPSIGWEEARAIARRELGVEAMEGDRAPALRILPVHGTGGVSHHLVWEVDHRTRDPIGWWISYVDAHEGRVLWRPNQVRHVDVTGTVTGVVEDWDYCFGDSTQALANMIVTILGTGESDTTGADGSFTIPAGVDSVTLGLWFEGPWLGVNVDADFAPDSWLEVRAAPGVPIVAHWDTTSSRWDERDTWLHGNRSHDWILGLDSTLTEMDYSMPCLVGIDETCGAYWDGIGINFSRASDECPNTGRIGDVVYHEYGHGVTWFMYGDLGDQPPSRIHEGNADIFDNLITGFSLIGNGLYYDCGNGTRDSDNDLCWPDDAQGGEYGHHDGQMLAGFIWDTREILVASLGESEGVAAVASAWHFGRKLGKPYTFEDQIFWTFVGDDDDGDLENGGTPNYGALCEGAENHCFVCPDGGVEIRHDDADLLWDAETPIDVTAKIYSTAGELNPDSLLVRYTVNDGGFSDEPLSGSAVDSLYSGAIPGQEEGSGVEFFILGEDVLGNRTTDPWDAPASLYGVYVDPTVEDDLETPTGWTVGALGDDAYDGIWVRVDPVGSFFGMHPVQPEDDHTPDPGVMCFVTGQNVEGQAPYYNDVDGGTTSLLSPVYNLSGASVADLNYYRWYTDDSDTMPEEEFWIVQVKNNDGPWMELENTTRSLEEWVRRQFDLFALFGEEIGRVQVVFRATDEPGFNQIVEAGTDDFWIHTDLGGGVVAVEPVPGGVPAATLLGAVTPNPARTGATIRYQLADGADVELSIYDVSGRAVRRLVRTEQDAGYYAIRWDGRTDEQKTVGSGIYFARLRAGEKAFVRQLAILR
jgi:hypothetical protein